MPEIVLRPREMDALRALMFDGADNHTLARRLGIKYETLKFYMRRLIERTGYPSRTALVLAYERGEFTVRVEDRNKLRAEEADRRHRVAIDSGM